MGFLSPWMLVGLGALSLPIWLHLLKRHRTTPLPFSSLFLFERHSQQSIKHRRLEHFLLLALRLALLAALVFAFAQPFLRRPVSTASGVHTVILLDDSVSMGYSGRMEQARKEALQKIDSLNPSSRAQVGTFSSAVRMLTESGSDVGNLKAAIAGVQTGSARSSFGELARSLRALAESSKLPLEVHIWSDFQKTALPAGFIEMRLSEGTRLVLHSVASKDEPNWTVESVTAPQRVDDPKKARVEAVIASYAADDAGKSAVLAVNGKDIARQPVRVTRDGKARVEFTGLDVPYGMTRCDVHLEPGDGLAADDRYLFTVERSDPKRVLFVYGPRAQRSVLYFKNALEAASGSAWNVEAVAVEQSGGRDPEKFSFTILSDVGELPAAFAGSLKKFASEGGKVWMALGPTSAATGKLPLLDAPVTESRYATRTGDRYYSLETSDESFGPVGKANRWIGVKFFQVVAADAGGGRILGRLTDQTPILWEKPLGEGRILVFASTLDNLSNDFPLSPAFVPFVEQMANYLAGESDRASGFLVDAAYDLRSVSGGKAALEVFGPDGKRLLGLEEAARAQNVVLEQTGYYEIRRPGGRQNLIAVNVDRRESDLRRIPDDALTLWQGGDEAKRAETTKREEQKPYSYGWPILVAASLFALFEALLANRTLRAETL